MHPVLRMRVAYLLLGWYSVNFFPQPIQTSLVCANISKINITKFLFKDGDCAGE